MSESAKRRVQRTKNHVINVKEKINDENYRVKQAKARAELIEVVVTKTHCQSCKTCSEQIDSIIVWDKSSADCTDPWIFRLNVLSQEQFRLFNYLPIRRVKRDKYLPTCPSCLPNLLETRQWKPE